MSTCIGKTIRQMTALDRAGYAVVTLRPPCEEDIRRVIRGYCHAERKNRFGSGSAALPGKRAN